MRNLLLTTCFGAVAAFAAGAAHANDELIKMSQNPKDWVMPAGDYANTALLEAQPDHRRQCRQAAGRLDVLDRRAARPRRRAAHHRQHDVRPHAVPEQGLRS